MSNVEETTSTIHFVNNRSVDYNSSDADVKQGMENTFQKLKDLEIILQHLCGEHGAAYKNIKAEWKEFCSVEESMDEKMDEYFVEMNQVILNRSNLSTKEEHEEHKQKYNTINQKAKELDLIMNVQNRLEEMELNDSYLQETLTYIQFEIQSRNTIGCDMESLVKKVNEILCKRKADEWYLHRSKWLKDHMTITEHSLKDNSSSSGVIEDMMATPSVPASMTSPLSGVIEDMMATPSVP